MRQAEAARIGEKYPDRIRVIVEKAERGDIADIDKKKNNLENEPPSCKSLLLFEDKTVP